VRGEKTMILLEGNIGAGKSTVGQTLKESGVFAFIEEPVGAWQEGFASNLLALFYENPKRWAFTFQLAAFTTRAKTWAEVLARTSHRDVVLERSIYCDRYIFARNCYESGLMEKTEWQLYCSLWDWVRTNWPTDPDVIVYLRTPAEVCLERIRERGRAEESKVPLQYLKDLERLHDEWLLENPQVIVLDGERRWTAQAVKAVLESRGVEHPSVAQCV